MKKWNVRSYKQGTLRTLRGALPKIMVHHEVIVAQIKTEALNRFFEKHPEDRNGLTVTASPMKVKRSFD
jgi:hypothetical protein